MKITSTDWKIAKTNYKKKTRRSGRGFKRSKIENGERIYSFNGGICCPFVDILFM